MHVFHCNNCEYLVFFESTQCVNCGSTLAFLPDVKAMGALDPGPDGSWLTTAAGEAQAYKLCENYTGASVCNWAIPVHEADRFCKSCRLNQVVPDVHRSGFRDAWYKLEVAKRRLIYTLDELGCCVRSLAEDPQGLAFHFLPDSDAPDSCPVLSGHANGVITINIAEADDAERERRRLQYREPYRTLLGHFRHESGHYYWDLRIKNSVAIDEFRALFGDERIDYGTALQAYYREGAPADWQQRFVSAYASAHPWEDWAETWAHYLHIVDTLETAGACGLSLRPNRADEPALNPNCNVINKDVPFQRLIDHWFPLTYVLNNLNRGLGLLDGYPFVLSPPAIEKLSFVHATIHSAGLD